MENVEAVIKQTSLQIAWVKWRDSGLTIQQAYELVHYWKNPYSK